MSNTSEERSNEIIADIQNLQNIETDLFKTLESGIANKTLSAEQQTSLVDQINKVSNMRESLYKNLNDSQSQYRGSVSAVGNIIGHQINALDIVETQLNESKKRLRVIEEERNNKLRLVEINTYYGEKYADHTDIMKTVVYFCIPLIILAILANSGILPHSIYIFIFIILIVVAVVIVWNQIVKAYSRDNMNYQEFVWGKEIPEKPYIDTSSPSGKDPWVGTGMICMAQECCDTGYTYVPSPTNKCIPNGSLPKGVKPYNPSQAQSVTSGTFSTLGVSSKTLGTVTSAASGAATQSVASVYDSLANL
jgi:hypothetical protein